MPTLIDLGELAKQTTINVAPDQDPAAAIPGMPPAFGQWMFPHVLSFGGTVGSLSKVYRPSDEALQDSWENARLMRNDLSIMECIEGRQRCVALLNWHLEPDNPKDPVQAEVAQHLTQICRKIPRFMQYRENLLHATFFGKYGVVHRWRWRRIANQWRIAPDRWRPVHGDKILFRYDPDTREWLDDQVGIRVGAMHSAHSLINSRWPVEKVRQVAPTSEGLAYFLRAHERSLVAIHKHYVEDGEYEVPHNAGRIHGVGVRSRIYWTWYQKQETLAWLMEYLERSAGGFEIWYYPQGNATAKEEVYKAARDRLSLGRNVILVPRTYGEPGAQPYDRIEPSMAGAEALKAIVVEYFGHQIKRYILGQTLTTEASNTGLGSNTADVHLATFFTIVEYDAQLLEETLTDDLIGPLMRYNFPWAQFGVRFKIDTKSDDAQEKMAAFTNAYQMGLKIKAQDVMDLVGASKPEPGDEVLWIGNRGPTAPGMSPGSPGAAGAPTGGPPSLPKAGSSPGEPNSSPSNAPEGDSPPHHSASPFARPSDPVDATNPRQPEQYARKPAPGQLSLFGTAEGAKDPEFERQHPRDPDGTFRDKNAGEAAASTAVPNAELKRKATGEHKVDDAEEQDLKRRYEEYVVAMHGARITPRPWEQWQVAVRGTTVPAPQTSVEGHQDDAALRKRYEQYVHDVTSHGITPRPWEQWRERVAGKADATPPVTASDDAGDNSPPSDTTPPPPSDPETATEGELSQDSGDPLDDQDELEEPGSGRAFEDDIETESTAGHEGDDNPREAAGRYTKALQDGYAYARASAVGNAGEDLLGSARHKVNQWKGLETAEEEGRGEELVTREHLLKGEPLDMLRHVTAANCLTGLAMHAAMRSFPPKPYDPGHRYYGRQPDDTKRQYRANYVDAYRTIKEQAEQLARDEVDPKKAIDILRGVVAGEITRIRKQGLPYDPVANNLVNLQNKLLTAGRPRPNSAMGQVLDFVGRLRTAYVQAEPTRDTLAKAAEHVRDVMEGDSLNKTFGTVGQGGASKGFSAADMYVTHATRKGGRVIDAQTVKAGQQFVVETLGMRGLQFGNYVTDEERQHHLRMSSEALADLMDVTGLPDNQASLGGVLGLAIGARGTSRALAHYEPGTKVINLTRTGGVGSLAHEWGHAFDHHVTGGQLVNDGNRLVGDYHSERISPSRFVKDEGGGWKRDQNGKMVTEDLSGDPLFQGFADLRKIWKDSGFDKQVSRALRYHYPSSFQSKAAYWASNHEKFARCFERYVQRRLQSDDRENTYLSGVTPEACDADHGFWPTDAQVDQMAPAFESIFAAWRSKLADEQRPTPRSDTEREKYSLIHALNAAARRQ